MGRRWRTTSSTSGCYDDDARARSASLGHRPRRPARAGAGRRARQRRPRPARGLLPRLDGHPRAARPTATASATSSASSTRTSATAGRSSSPTSGCASATPGRSRGPSTRSRSHFYGRTEHVHRRAAAGSGSRWVDTRQVLGMPYDTPVAGLRQQHRQHPAAVAGAGLGGVRPRRLQRAATTSRRSRRRTSRRTSPRCSTRTTSRSWARSCGSSSSTSSWPARSTTSSAGYLQDARRLRRLRRQGGDPAQRHAPGHRHRRADAHPRRRARPAVGARPGRSAGPPSATPTTPCCPRRSSAGRWTSSGACCRATSRSSTRSTGASSRRCAGATAGRRGRASARMSLIEEGPVKQVRMANLAVVGSHSVNGVAALHTELLKTRALPRLRRAVARAVQQQDQRRHPAPLAPPGQPRAGALITECIGPGWRRDLDELRRLEPLADDEAFRRRFREVKRREQGAAGRDHPARERHRPSTWTRSSTSR